jgi:hypothetical protein
LAPLPTGGPSGGYSSHATAADVNDLRNNITKTMEVVGAKIKDMNGTLAIHKSSVAEEMKEMRDTLAKILVAVENSPSKHEHEL